MFAHQCNTRQGAKDTRWATAPPIEPSKQLCCADVFTHKCSKTPPHGFEEPPGACAVRGRRNTHERSARDSRMLLEEHRSISDPSLLTHRSPRTAQAPGGSSVLVPVSPSDSNSVTPAHTSVGGCHTTGTSLLRCLRENFFFETLRCKSSRGHPVYFLFGACTLRSCLHTHGSDRSRRVSILVISSAQ